MQRRKLAIYIAITSAFYLSCFSAVQAMDPDVLAKKVICHTCLMKIYVAQGNTGLATTEFQELLKLTPNDPVLHFDYGNFLARNEKPDLAVTQFKLAAKLKPSVPEFQVGLGNGLMYAKDYTGAVAAYNKAVCSVVNIKTYCKKRSNTRLSKNCMSSTDKKFKLKKMLTIKRELYLAKW